MYVGQFHLVGTHPDAVQHTWQDTILTKDYWRSALSSVGGRLGRRSHKPALVTILKVRPASPRAVESGSPAPCCRAGITWEGWRIWSQSLPRELGRWRDGKLEWFHDLGTSDVVVKLPDAYLGIGDAFWTHGEDY
eukprot:gene13516-biopygen12978